MIAKEISPAACAVLGALEEVAYDWASMEQASPRVIAAAVLRAVAEQTVVPLPKTPSEYDIAQYDGRVEVIENLLAIADEL